MFYKSKKSSFLTQHFTNSLQYLQSSLNSEDQETLTFQDLIVEVNSIYDSNDNSFNIQDLDYLTNFLDCVIYTLQNSQDFSTDYCFFQFFIYLLTSYQANDAKIDNLIKEKALICSSFLVSTDCFPFDELSLEILDSTFQLLQKNPTAIIPSIIAIKDEQYTDLFLSSCMIEQIIEIIDKKEFTCDHFYFISKYSKYLKRFVSDELIEKFIQIAYDHSNQSYGFYFLSILVKHYELKSNEVDSIIHNHLMFKNNENAPSLIRILNFYSMDNHDFFKKPNFFADFFDYFEICELKNQIKMLNVVYMLSPYFLNDLMPFICNLIEISSNCDFLMISKICDILLVLMDQLNDTEIAENFINSEIFEIFERILSSDCFNDYYKIIEILMRFKKVDKVTFFQFFNDSAIPDVLDRLRETDNEFIHKFIQDKIAHLYGEEEEEDFDYDCDYD